MLDVLKCLLEMNRISIKFKFQDIIDIFDSQLIYDLNSLKTMINSYFGMCFNDRVLKEKYFAEVHEITEIVSFLLK